MKHSVLSLKNTPLLFYMKGTVFSYLETYSKLPFEDRLVCLVV
jgi:hypothetical protein